MLDSTHQVARMQVFGTAYHRLLEGGSSSGVRRIGSYVGMW